MNNNYLKYLETMVTFTEVPDEISLCINITNCPCHCKNCSEPWLAEDSGDKLDVKAIKKLVETHNHITCICFMGGDSNPLYLSNLCRDIKSLYPELKLAMYSGFQEENFWLKQVLDYYKVGPWREELGGLDKTTTNQIFYKKEQDNWIDITYRFQTKKE